ncbi:hypothetical protein KQH82_04330 [bacterium]|nr:hypothetical protein [bacterium]
MKDDFVEPTAEESWQYIKKTHCRNSRHVIAHAPGFEEHLGKEVVVVEAPRRNMKTVRIEINGIRKRWPIMWLRPILTEEMRGAMRNR